MVFFVDVDWVLLSLDNLMSVTFDGLVGGTSEGLATRVVFLSQSWIDLTQQILKKDKDRDRVEVRI